MSKISELQREKARQLRYRKPIIRGLSTYDILNGLYDIIEAAQEITYYFDDPKTSDTMLDALCGDEDDEYEFKMQFGDLEADAERMLDELRELSVGEWFNTMLAAALGGDDIDMCGYDSVEHDYFPIYRYMNHYATEAATKQMESHTKHELIQMLGTCLSIYTNYISLQTRYLSLKAALDILKGTNTEVLLNAKRINELYENFEKNGCETYSSEACKLDAAASHMPAEVWLS